AWARSLPPRPEAFGPGCQIRRQRPTAEPRRPRARLCCGNWFEETSGRRARQLARASPRKEKLHSRPGAHTPRPSTRPPERSGELAEEGLGDGLPADPEGSRLPAGGEVESAEEDVEGGEEAGEVLVQSFVLRGVVPVVEDRAREDVAEGVEGPAHVG